MLGIVIGAALESSRTKWIETKKRTPVLQERILLLNRYGNIMLGTYTSDGFYIYYSTGFSKCTTIITHWQPLPKTK